MKNSVYFLAICFLFFLSGTSCVRDEGCQDKTIQSEAGPIAAYASANGMVSGTTHSSGIFYQITSQGSGATPGLNSTVSVRYVGKLLDGTTFDSQTGSPVNFPLSGMIKGWQIGLQLIQKGGSIKLIIPSSLAYGCTGYGTIPGNAILFFDIQLVDVL